MRVDLIIFDCDGVLVDSEVIACRLLAQRLLEEGVSVSVDEVLDRYVGVSLKTVTDDLLARENFHASPAFLDNLRLRTNDAFELELKAIEGVGDVVRLLGVPICVASSGSPERIRHSLKLTGLLQDFSGRIFSATQVARGKPHPDLFLFAADQMGVCPEYCVVVEDSIAGVEAGCAAGMVVLGFTGGSHCKPSHAERLVDRGAFVAFNSMEQLPEIILALRDH